MRWAHDLAGPRVTVLALRPYGFGGWKGSMDRRRLLAAGFASALTASVAARASGRRDLRLTLLGQSLIEHELSPAHWPGRAAIAARLARADVCFTNLETVIQGPRAGAPTRERLTLHAGDAGVLETLKGVHVNLLATAGNHAFDLGSGGVVDTLDAIRAAGLPSAGTALTSRAHRSRPGARRRSGRWASSPSPRARSAKAGPPPWGVRASTSCAATPPVRW